MRKVWTLLTAASMLLVLAVPAMAQEDARIHLIHGIPDTNVDVVAGGEVVFENFAFGETQDLSSLAGATREGLEVRLTGTETVAIDGGDVALPVSGNFTITCGGNFNPSLNAYGDNIVVYAQPAESSD